MDVLFWGFEQQGDSCLLLKINLSQRLIILLLLVGAHRLGITKLFSVNKIALNDLSVTFLPTVVPKYFRKGKLLDKF